MCKWCKEWKCNGNAGNAARLHLIVWYNNECKGSAIGNAGTMQNEYSAKVMQTECMSV